MNQIEFLNEYSVDRRHTNSSKWDGMGKRLGYDAPDLLSLWIADMDFKVPREVTDALIERVNHGAYGYTLVPEDYFDAINGWLQRHHGYTVDERHVRFCGGVVTGFYNAVNAFTKPGDSVLVFTPVYPPFQSAPEDTSRKLITSPLIRDEEGHYTIDFNDMEAKITEHDVKLIIFCNPHNPAGRVWTEEELDTVFSICEAHDVIIVSDEIHQDFIFEPHKFTSALTVKDGHYKNRLIALFSASKTFSLPSLPISHVVIPDQTLRRQYDEYTKAVDHTPLNVLSLESTKAAFAHGDEWFDALKEVILDNYNYFKEELLKVAPELVITPLEGTYLAWVDFSAYMEPEKTNDFLLHTCKLATNPGSWFSKDCASFARFNLGTSPDNIKEAVARLSKGLESLKVK